MLAPTDRRYLLDLLRPPVDYELSFAVGTTYSLDLVSLLIAPVAFTNYELPEEGKRLRLDPVALLCALRRHAEKIRIFCQAGQIDVPKPGQLLFSQLENSVVEAYSPREGGVFHPKVWVIRFAPLAAGAAIRYRFLCLTRNLTFDRSWDTALALEDAVADRKVGYRNSHPLADFVQALPTLTRNHIIDPTGQKWIDLMQEELRRVKWSELPPPFESVTFWPLLGRRQWPFPDTARRLLVMSPFVGASRLQKLPARPGGKNVLVARPDELARLTAAQLAGFQQIYTLDPIATSTSEAEDNEGASAGTLLAGLHAKCYVVEDGDAARVWTGSANATEAAFTRNVEFLVELTGKKAACGINALLGGNEGLQELLQPYQPPPAAVPPDPTQELLEKRLQAAILDILRLDLLAKVDPPDANATYAVRLTPRRPDALPRGQFTATCWPITARPDQAVPFHPDGSPTASLGRLTIEALTPFIAFEVTVAERGQTLAARFALKLPLEGAPENRLESLLQHLLTDRDAMLRYLYLLLMPDSHRQGASPADYSAMAAGFEPDGARATPKGPDGWPLFESLVQSLASDRKRLQAVADAIRNLEDAEGAALLPPGFHDIWDPIWECAQEAGLE